MEPIPSHLIFWPLLLQVALTLGMYIKLAREKDKSLAAGTVDRKKAALNPEAWPESVIKVNNNIRNQFETPVIFYIVSLTLVSLQALSFITLLLAWFYVISRVVHAYIHTGTNNVKTRKQVFTVGCIILMLMWLFTGVNLIYT